MELIIETLIQWLSQAGIHCYAGFESNPFPQLECPMVAVSLEGARFSPIGLDGLLAPDTPGLSLTATVHLDIYDNHRFGVQGYLATVLSIVSACAGLWSRFPWELLRVGLWRFEPDLDCFHCDVSLPLNLLLAGREVSE